MPDFNYNAPLPRSEIVNEFTSVMEHWINATGVHGFRCDAARYLVENGAHANLRKDQPATHAIWKTYRRNLEAIDPEVILLAEAPTETTGQLVAYYGEGDEFHSAFHFGFPGLLVGTVRDGRRRANLLSDLFAVQSRLPSGTQDTVFLSNHDQFAGDRVASQLGGDLAKMKSAASLYLLLSGNPAIYYGEEIGMTGAGNDAALRQPMDFAAADAQRLDPDSLMNHYARLLRVRNHYDALRAGISFFARSHAGGWDCMNCEANRLGLIREYFGETIVVFHNFSPVTLAVHVDLTSNSTGLDIPVGTPVTPLMGGGTYPAVDPGNRGFYPLGEVHPLTSRVLFLGDPAGYRDATGTLLTYENAVSAP
jgi:glycosidase